MPSGGRSPPRSTRLLLDALVKMRLICNALALHDPELAAKDPERTAPKLRELRAILDDEVGQQRPQGHPLQPVDQACST